VRYKSQPNAKTPKKHIPSGSLKIEYLCQLNLVEVKASNTV